MNELTAPLFFGTLGWFCAAALTWFSAGQPGPLGRPAAAARLAAAMLGMALNGLVLLFTEGREESFIWVFVLFQVGTAGALAEFVRTAGRTDEVGRWPVWVVPAVTLSVAATVPSLTGVAQFILGGLLAGGAWLAAAALAGRTRASNGPTPVRYAQLALVAGMAATAPVPLLGFSPSAPDLVRCASVVPWVVVAGLGGALYLAARARRGLLLGLGGGLLLLALGAPPAINRALILTEARADADLRSQIAEAARQINPHAVLSVQDPGALAALLRASMRGQPLVQRAMLWTADDTGRRRRLAAVGEAVNGPAPPERAMTEAERAGRAGRAAFRTRDEAGAWVWHAPVPYTGTGAVWLAWAIPEAVWAQRFAGPRVAALSVAATLAVLGAAGLVLAWRQALEQARVVELERSEAASRAKTEFLAFLGHELRTPLQVIIGRAEWLRDGRAGADPVATAAEIALHSRVMLRLVGDLLDLGTIEAGKLELQPTVLELPRLIAAAVVAAQTAAAGKPLTVRAIGVGDLPQWVRADEARLLQVLGNLLGNAVRYTATGSIDLLVSIPPDRMPPVAESAWVRFVVRDTGIGLPEDQIARLFTLFTRLDSGSAFTREGTGIGLALVQRLVGLMGGEVRAANRTDGPSGAAFTVDLLFPVVADAVAVTVAPDGAAGGRRESAVRARFRVLVAEDNAAIARLFADQLAQLGGEVVGVADGLAAWSRTEREEFDLVLLDINLPGLDGVSLARRLRERRGPGRRPRIVGCSAEVLPETTAAAVAAGMEQVLAKPVSFDDLRRLVGGADESIFGHLQRGPEAAAAQRLARTGIGPALAELRVAIAGADWAAVLRQVHWLRASAKVLADEALENDLAALAWAAENGRADEADAARSRMAARDRP